MRSVLIVILAAGSALLLGPAASHAYGSGPWCAMVNTGGNEEWNCGFASLDLCRQQVIAGNRGFCNPNPAWQGPAPTVRRHGRRHRSYD